MYAPYVVDYTQGKSVSPEGEVNILDWLDDKIELFFIPNFGVAFKCQKYYKKRFNPQKEIFFDKRNDKIWDLPDNARPATRKEIIDAGLWDYVINKDNYSSESDEIETKLEEYLRIGEELVKESKQNL